MSNKLQKTADKFFQAKKEIELRTEIAELKKQVETLKKFIESCCVCGSMGSKCNHCLFCDQLKEIGEIKK